MPMPELIDALCALPCFREVPRPALVSLANKAKVRKFDTRDEVLAQGAGTDAAYLVIQGMLEVSVQTQKTWHHIATIAPGELAGESALFIRGVPRNATVMAHKPSICLELTPTALRELSGNPAVVALELALVAALSRRIRKTNLEIQAAWKHTHPDDSPETGAEDAGPKTFAGRLRSIFKGRGSQR